MSYIYVVQTNIPAELEAEFNRLYDEEHVPSFSQVPGCRKITRYRLEKSEDSRMQKYLTIYEVDSPVVVESETWRAARECADPSESDEHAHRIWCDAERLQILHEQDRDP